MLTLTRADRDACPRIEPGQQFAISLERASGTGYRWNLVFSEDQLSLVTDRETSASPTKPGALVTQEWIFTSRARGIAHIRCMLARPWEQTYAEIVEFKVDCQ